MDRLPVAIRTAGAGLWQRLDLVAAPAGLAGRGRVGEAPRPRLALVWRPGRRRRESGEPGQHQRPDENRGEQTGPYPPDRGNFGSKDPLVVDRSGIPLLGRLSAANAHDATQLLTSIGVSHPRLAPAQRDGRDECGRLRAHADAEIAHATVWLNSNDHAGIETFAPVLEALDRG